MGKQKHESKYLPLLILHSNIHMNNVNDVYNHDFSTKEERKDQYMKLLKRRDSARAFSALVITRI